MEANARAGAPAGRCRSRRAPGRSIAAAVISFAAAVAIACTACTGRSAEDDTLVFVGWKPDQPAAWDEAVRRFEASHPAIHVRREIGPTSSSAFHDLVTQKLKNRDPRIDVYFMDVVWLAEFAAAGWALPLDRYFPDSARGEFLGGSVAASVWRGGVYGVPAFIDAGLLYYRKDLLTKHGVAVPRTWPELESAAQRILDAEARPPEELVGYSAQLMQYEGLVCNLLEVITANRGRLLRDDGERAALDDPRTLEAIRWVRDRVVGGLAPRSIVTYQEPESLAPFLQGRVVFLRDWPYAWQVVNDPAQSRVVGQVGIAPLPSFPGGESRSTLGGWFYGINAASRKADAAWQFVEFMTSPEIQKFFAREASLAPTRKALYRDPDVLRTNPQFSEQAEVFRLAVPRPITPVYPAVSAALQRFFSTAITRPQSDIAAEAAAAAREINGYLELAR